VVKKETIEKIKKILLEERAKILAKLERSSEEQNSSREKQGVGDEIDSAVEMEMENLRTVLSGMEVQRLRQIDEALRKIEEGTYGYCEECGEPIEEGRLLAKPFATLCISCKEAKERQKF